MTLFSDPPRWSKFAVGSGWGLGLLISIHFIMCGVTGAVLYNVGMAFLMIPILLIGIGMPFMYLYALRKLLDSIISQDQPVSRVHT
jgi:hypothetical protein